MMMETMPTITDAVVPPTATDASRPTADETHGATDRWILSVIALVAIAEIAFVWWLLSN